MRAAHVHGLPSLCYLVTFWPWSFYAQRWCPAETWVTVQELFDGSWAKYGARTRSLRVMDEHRFVGAGEEPGQNAPGTPSQGHGRYLQRSTSAA